MLTTAFVIMQFIISAKAGLVNAVEGSTNVRAQQQVAAGAPIQTGPSGRVEVLLNPGSFLRLGENSEAVFDSVDLTNISLRIMSGDAVIESSSIGKDTPIHVTNGQMKLSIVASGLYRFSTNTAAVLDGELRTSDSGLSIKKGWQVSVQGDQYEETKISQGEQVTSLEQWSQQRSEQIAGVNSRSAETDSATSYQRQLLYPGSSIYPGGSLPYSLSPGVVPLPTPFSFFHWYSGGYGFYQPLIPTPPPIIYAPFAIRPIPYPYASPGIPGISHPPAPRPSAPAPQPVMPAPHPSPSRPAPRGGFRGR